MAATVPRSDQFRIGEEPCNDAQSVEVRVAGGYHPPVVTVEAGRPVRLVFRREDAEPCADRVVFSSPRLDRRLAPNRITIVDLPPLAVDVRFTCAMGRYRGRIHVVPPGSPQPLRATRMGAGVATLIAACTALLVTALVTGTTAVVVLVATMLAAQLIAVRVHLRRQRTGLAAASTVDPDEG